MDDTRASELLSQNLTAIYGYAFSKLYDKSKAEDVACEIVCEIIGSAKKLKNEEAFWGFAWRIAENTFRRFLRREELIRRSEQQERTDEDDRSGGCNVIERDFIEREEKEEKLYLLRRELSLLGRVHREVCVAYYIDNRSCSQIAKEQNISVEMVKQHLFKTRRLLKEGIGMTRALGEKSYNPGTFRLDFWGDYNRYGDIFKRKMPGAIALTAYSAPVTAEEISVELGVSMPYLEEEIQTLEDAGILLKTGNKYRTNLVILTDEYEKEFARQTEGSYKELALGIFEQVKELLPRIREMDFRGREYDDNRLLAGILNIAMVRAYIRTKEKSPIGTPRKLALGGSGWIFGYDNDYSNHHYCGITMETWNQAKTAWFSAENYNVFKSCQLYEHYRMKERAEGMCDAILGKEADRGNETLPHLIEGGFIRCEEGRLSANFPVFDRKVFAQLCDICKPVSEAVADCMIDRSNRAEKLLKTCVPEAVKDQCGEITKIHHRLEVMALLMEALIADGKITVPQEKTPLCVWGVRNEDFLRSENTKAS